MNENIENLLKLIKENPEREVVTMVETEIVASDDFGRWISSIGKSRLDSYFMRDENVYFKSNLDELMEETLDFLYYDYENDNKSDEEIEKMAEEYIERLEWQEAIIVNVDTHFAG